jgi:ATP-dependent RNA helicase DeaD
VFVGGRPIKSQLAELQRGVQIAVGTPGRVIDLLSRRALDLRNLKIAVLDEADRMLDIGFRPDIEKILRQCPSDRQTLLLSATVPPPIMRLAQRYMRDPETVDFSPSDISVETIEQFYFTVDPEQKFELLVYGLFAAEATLGSFVWSEFPCYKHHVHPVRRRELELLWAWHESREAA